MPFSFLDETNENSNCSYLMVYERRFVLQVPYPLNKIPLIEPSYARGPFSFLTFNFCRPLDWGPFEIVVLTCRFLTRDLLSWKPKNAAISHIIFTIDRRNTIPHTPFLVNKAYC